MRGAHRQLCSSTSVLTAEVIVRIGPLGQRPVISELVDVVLETVDEILEKVAGRENPNGLPATDPGLGSSVGRLES